MTSSEPRNPFYLLLLIASVLFVMTALAYAVVPTLEQHARDAGQAPPASIFRDSLRQHGGLWLLGELGGMIIFGVASMALDRVRSLKQEKGPIPANQTAPTDPGNSTHDAQTQK
jgi:hypothetical protein